MTKDQVFEVLKKYILEQLEDEITEEEITLSKSLIDLGANSLDIVEIISNVMRDLEIKVPRDELAKINNIEGIVSTMTEYKNK